jgi:hypothetical protein
MAIMKSVQCCLLSALILGNGVVPALAYYHPDQGRWLSRDPIEPEHGMHLYRIAWNNMVDVVDYLGLMKCCDCRPGLKTLEANATIVEVIEDLRRRHRGDNFSAPICLADVKCGEIQNGDMAQRGDFDPNTSVVTINCGETDGVERGGSKYEIKAYLLHELQHAENWCRRSPRGCAEKVCDEVKAHVCDSGGNPEDFLTKLGIVNVVVASVESDPACRIVQPDELRKMAWACDFSREGCMVADPESIPEPITPIIVPISGKIGPRQPPARHRAD